MPEGPIYLREAAERLASIDFRSPNRRDLADAFRRVWFASADWPEWPRELRRHAEELFMVFFRRGGINDTAARMTDAEARTAVAALRCFLEEAQRSAAPRKPR